MGVRPGGDTAAGKVVLICLPRLWIVTVCVQPVSASCFHLLGSCAAPCTPQRVTATSVALQTARGAGEMLGGASGDVKKLLRALGRSPPAGFALSKGSIPPLGGLRGDDAHWMAGEAAG